MWWWEWMIFQNMLSYYYFWLFIIDPFIIYQYKSSVNLLLGYMINRINSEIRSRFAVINCYILMCPFMLHTYVISLLTIMRLVEVVHNSLYHGQSTYYMHISHLVSSVLFIKVNLWSSICMLPFSCLYQLLPNKLLYRIVLLWFI